MMLKTFKHPLFKRELMQVRWSTLLFAVATLLPILVAINQLYDKGYGVYTMESADLITSFPLDMFGWLTLPVIIISQFFYTRKENVIGLLASLPYSRNEQTKYKYLAGASGVLFGYVLCFLIFSATYFSASHPITGPYSNIVFWVLIAYLCTMFQYSFYFFIATVMGNSVFAGIGGFFMFLSPLFIVMSILFNIDMVTPIMMDVEPILNFVLPHYPTYAIHWYDKTITFTMILPLLVGYTIGSILFYLLGKYFYNKNDFEYNGNMCMFKWAEMVFIAGFTLCFGLLALDFAQLFDGGWLYPLAILGGLACFPLGYILSKKLLQITGHQLSFKHS